MGLQAVESWDLTITTTTATISSSSSSNCIHSSNTVPAALRSELTATTRTTSSEPREVTPLPAFRGFLRFPERTASRQQVNIPTCHSHRLCSHTFHQHMQLNHKLQETFSSHKHQTEVIEVEVFNTLGEVFSGKFESRRGCPWGWHGKSVCMCEHIRCIQFGRVFLCTCHKAAVWMWLAVSTCSRQMNNSSLWCGLG